jgi:hypothetical protein
MWNFEMKVIPIRRPLQKKFLVNTPEGSFSRRAFWEQYRP